MMFYGSQIWKKKRIFHILQPVGGFNKTEKYAYQIGSSRQVGITIKDLWNHQIRSTAYAPTSTTEVLL